MRENLKKSVKIRVRIIKKCIKIRVRLIKRDFGKSLSFLSKKRLY